MGVVVKFFGTGNPKSGASPVRVLNNPKFPFGNQKYGVNWMTGKHPQLGPDTGGSVEDALDVGDPVVVGLNEEGGEDALQDTWAAEGANALEAWIVTRVVYNHQGNMALYAFLRKFTFSKSGRLASVSGETRVTVDDVRDIVGLP
jgi:hypothetical protein